MALPRIIILPKLLAHFRAAVQALPEEERFIVRHSRFRRKPTAAEVKRGVVSIEYVGDDAQGVSRATDGDELSQSEEVYDLNINLVAECELPPEKDEAEDGSDLGDDETGLAEASRMIEILLGTLFTPGEQPETLDGTVRNIRYDGSAPEDEESSTDNVRLAERIALEYATRTEAPTHLLLGE